MTQTESHMFIISGKSEETMTMQPPWAGFSTAEPWLPVDARHPSLSVATQDADAGSMLSLTRRLVALRKAHEALRTGAYRPVEAPEPLIVFQRGQGAGALLCAFNPTGEAVDWRLPDGWRAIQAVNGGEKGFGPYAAVVAERLI